MKCFLFKGKIYENKLSYRLPISQYSNLVIFREQKIYLTFSYFKP